MESIDILKMIAAVIALMVAIIGHEIMHGWVAYKFGDTTAKNAGRLSINPIVHIDMVGSIIVPVMTYFIPVLLGADNGFLFGWAKPVPVNQSIVIHNGGYNAAMQVSLAGIAYNFSLAILSSVILLGMDQPTMASSMLEIFAYLLVIQFLIINVVLGVFNLLPIPAFDGAHFIIYLSLKLGYQNIARFFAKFESYGMIIVIIVLITPLKDYVLVLPVQMVLKLLLN